MKGRQSTGVYSPWGEEPFPSLAVSFTLPRAVPTGRAALTHHPVPLVRPANPIKDLALIHHTAAWSSTLWCHSQIWFHGREKTKRQKRLNVLRFYSNLLRGAKRRSVPPKPQREREHSFSHVSGKTQFWRYPGAPTPSGSMKKEVQGSTDSSWPNLATGGRQAGTIWFTQIKRVIFYPLFSL